MVLILKSLVEMWGRIFAMLLGMMHISLVSLLRALSNFRYEVLEKGIAQYA